MKTIGKIRPKRSVDIQKSKIGLGFEKLDRDSFDPEKAYDLVAESGVKWARLQSGWQKTEQQMGVYDFAWLDAIVDKMIAIGVTPWLCLCYGNKLYTKEAESVFGAVGCPPIKTGQERAAWLRYVKATVTHFKGRIHYYEIWNEPDGQWCWKHGVNAEELAAFTIATADACKEADRDCETIGFVTCCYDEPFHKTLCESGVCDHIDAISYHSYCIADHQFVDTFQFFDRLRQKYAPRLKIIQGESGTQSRPDGCGALAGGAWTEEKQVKFLLRHLIIDISLGVEFTSYFSCMDMAEALNGETGNIQSISDFGYFGVIGADFDEQARATGNYYKKPSYYALQTLASVLCGEYMPVSLCIEPIQEWCALMQGMNFDLAKASRYAFSREDGSAALFFWKDAEILTETYAGVTSFKIKMDVKPCDVRLVDMANGQIFELDEEQISVKDGWVYLRNIPITDSPMMLDLNHFYQET